MQEEELYHTLITCLKMIKIPFEDVTIKFRPYSKTYYGRYFPQESKLYIYPYADMNGTLMNFSDIFCTTIHEMVHHIQHQDPNFKRCKGVMHDPQFWKLYNHFIDRAVKLGILEREEVENYG